MQQKQQDQLDNSASSPEQPSPQQQPGKKAKKLLDLTKLDEKSVKVMVMLMIHLVTENITTQQFFEEVIFEQNVKTKKKQFTMTFLKTEDFFRVL